MVQRKEHGCLGTISWTLPSSPPTIRNIRTAQHLEQEVDHGDDLGVLGPQERSLEGGVMSHQSPDLHQPRPRWFPLAHSHRSTDHLHLSSLTCTAFTLTGFLITHTCHSPYIYLTLPSRGVWYRTSNGSTPTGSPATWLFEGLRSLPSLLVSV